MQCNIRTTDAKRTQTDCNSSSDDLKQVRKERVGYDWNKRLMELRKRHLSRKFLKIWILKTSGRILPHTAKTQDQSVVLRQAFKGWKDEWWASRKGSCLTTLANCYYRYYLYHLAFQHWQTFISLQKEKKSKGHLAVQFADRQLMHLAWNRWDILRDLRMKKRMLESALELKKLKSIQSAWHIWQTRLQQHQNIHVIKKQDLKRREEASQQRDFTQQVDVCLSEHILPSCFKSWVELTLHRRLQKQRTHKADMYNQQRLYTWVFCTWWARTEKHKDQMLSERLAVLHEEKSHLQRAWRCWKEKIHDKEQQTASIQLSLDTQPYTTVTMWKDISTDIQDMRHEGQQVCSQSDQYVSKRAVDKCKQVLIAWREVTHSAVSAKQQQREALTRCQMSLSQVRQLQCFRQWRREATHAHTEKIYMERARWHHESKLLTKAMKAWNGHHNQYHMNKVMKRQGIFLLRLKMYQKFFDLWKVKLHNRRREAELSERALWHWSLTLQGKVLCGWRWWVTEQHTKQEQAAGAAQADRDEPLTEDLKGCLTDAAHIKDLPAGPTEDSQEQEPFCLLKRSQRIHRVVSSCALHWKQRALSKLHTEQELKQGPQKKKTVTFSCTPPELKIVPSKASVEEEDDTEELRKLFANRTRRRRPRGLLESLLENLHKQLSVTDTAAAPEPVLSSLHSSKADVLLGGGSSSSLSSVCPDVHVGESCRRTNRADSASSLTEELHRIQQDMNSYQHNRKQLRAWKKLKEVLQRWIQTSGRDDQSEINTVCQEIKELEERIDRLSSDLAKQKPTMLLYAERIQRLQAVFAYHYVLTASH